MAWEQVPKNQTSGPNKPKAWYEFPCLSLNKTGLSFNTKFIEVYGWESGMGVEIFVDRENFRVGFKKCLETDGYTPCYKLSQRDESSNKRGSTWMLSCKKIQNVFPDCVGYVYRAKLNPAEKIIEIDLTRDEK